MEKKMFQKIFGTHKPIIGMVHLRPLPGSPKYDHSSGMEAIIEAALEDTKQLVQGGIDGIQIENQWDRPFLKADEIGFETIAAIAAVISRLRVEYTIPMGVNIHLNGVCQAIAVAIATGCRWIRAFELANAYVSNAGIIEAAGPKALRYRAYMRAEDNVMIFGDFHVKHGSHQIISDRSLQEQAEDVQTALGDAVIVTGLKTGSPPDRQDIEMVRGSVELPILIGSGLSLNNMEDLLPMIDGAIIGSYFKKDGKLSNPVDADRVSRFMEKATIIRES
jgi:membrane complex biogenesis BtpA family protein